MKKSIIFITVITIIIVIFWKQAIFAQGTLQFGTFTPQVTLPPEGLNAECSIDAAEKLISNYKNKGLSKTLENASQGLLSCDIYRYVKGCTNPNSEDCTKPCIYIVNGASAEQIQKYPGVSENVADFHAMSSLMYPSSYLYTKMVGRFDIRNGFGLTQDGKEEAKTTLLAMTCAERTAELGHHLGTPLYFYPTKTQEMILTLPHTSSFKLVGNPTGIFSHQGKQYSSLSFELSGVSASFSPKSSGKLLDGENLEDNLEKVAQELQFTPSETADFVSYWKSQLPSSAYYFVTLISQDEARTLTPWTVSPKPDTEIRYLFTFKPLVGRKNIPVERFIPYPRRGFTVVDIGGIILW